MNIANYNDKTYDYTQYWEGRDYEDFSEKSALSKLLTEKGKSIIDIGGGFGRLIPSYKDKFESITIFDYSDKILAQAREFATKINAEITTQQGDIYHISEYFGENKFDYALMMRVCHHLEDLPSAISEIKTILEPDAFFIIEFANKIHFKSVLKNLFKLNLKYFNLTPISIATKNVVFYNFHPTYVKNILEANGFKIITTLSVSNFRQRFFKKLVPIHILNKLESILQKPLSVFYFGPSIIYKCQKI